MITTYSIDSSLRIDEFEKKHWIENMNNIWSSPWRNGGKVFLDYKSQKSEVLILLYNDGYT